MADNPEAESAPTTDEEAVSFVSSRLMEPPEPTETEEETPQAEEEPVEGEAEAEPEEQEEDEASSKEEEEAEPESVELPDTLDGFAAELGVDPKDLADHLRVTVTVNGEKQEVTLAEAIAGQQRDSDYRQKTMELAEQRKAMEAESQKLSESWQHRVEALDAALAMAEKLVPGPTDEELAQLVNSDPAEYLRVKHERDQRQQAISAMKEERERARWEQQQQMQQQQMQYRQEQQRLLSQKVEEVNNPESLKAFERNAADALKSYGYTDDEVKQAFLMFDHRNILVLRDAMKYRQLEEGKGKLAKKLKPLPKVAKPGSPVKKGKNDALVASRDRLRKMSRGGTKQQQEESAVEYVKQLMG